ncbi:hypothetical protein [Devosia sp. 63-57]|uniref:hypothetical protein n=1 Tax=Devosia sp. 63-57 TaxID=1895751 RepID=UPI00086D90D9|nr:hypothetical protein [Devosia sp. 63-57]ODT48636.1 MAG: hypothetical protein ABS74_11355 [Pelagibacterium sp. SCN 63-126]ODU86534.1 MAG: hypothetical protein ABT14_08675 [Pelagibacterium sp. SCN 63-17]OJX45112.1 MAG: hypothetical protein BGO80_04555 [Devosia sp. 63-57]
MLKYWLYGPLAILSEFRIDQLLLGFGCFFVVVGVGLFHFGTVGEDWPAVRAKILSVEKQCVLTSSIGYRQVSRQIRIPCDQVDQFFSDNGSDRWSLSARYRGQVRLIGDKQTTLVEMDLPGGNSGAVVGREFSILQNPANLTETRRIGDDMTFKVFGGVLMALGAFLLANVFLWL